MFETRRLYLVLCLLSQFVHQIQLELVNVALEKPTYQVDTFENCDSSKAVDGSIEKKWEKCAYTSSTKNTFWIVDLLGSHTIEHIDITNRDKEEWRMNGFYIYVSEMSPFPIPSHDGTLPGELCLVRTTKLPKGGPHTVKCVTPGTRGRYVYIWKPGFDELIFCEFSVYTIKPSMDLIQMGYFIYPGKRSHKSPFASFIMVDGRSKMDCVRICSSASGGSSTTVQLEKETKTCECIEESNLGEPVPDIDDAGWTLIKSFNN